jgi:two-component system cell cycle response regulator
MARVRSLVRLKMALDEWRAAREYAATQFGAVSESPRQRDDTNPWKGARVLVVDDKDIRIRTKISETLYA